MTSAYKFGTITRETISDFLESEAGLDSEEVRWNYSGRGMYGKSCFGLVGSMSDFAAFLVELGRRAALSEDDDEATDWETLCLLVKGSVSMDSMGLHSIMYFPAVYFEGEEDS